MPDTYVNKLIIRISNKLYVIFPRNKVEAQP